MAERPAEAAAPKRASKPLEDYGYIGNMLTGALVARDGSIDWLCLPHFDSDACFTALLGTPEDGCWKLAPAGEVRKVERRYRPHTTILETRFETENGAVTLIDFMPLSADEERGELIRVVVGESGAVRMRSEWMVRFGYGANKPWIRRQDYGFSAVAGPDMIEIHTPVHIRRKKGIDLESEFIVRPGDAVPFRLSYHASNKDGVPGHPWRAQVEELESWWCEWSGRCDGQEERRSDWNHAVSRSLITLKAMSFHPTGALVAAPTTSLPEQLGGPRNWDYRFCWIRDATLTLYALITSGYSSEAKAWRSWLLRTAAGSPDQMQIMYGIDGRRRLSEQELPWLAGYEGSRPVRIGNAAHQQMQIDVYGELIDALYVARKFDLDPDYDSWRVQQVLLKHLASIWDKPDQGIWEMRGPPRHFTHSKMMAWVAFDRAVKAAESFGLDGPIDEWAELRDRIHADICANGYDASRNTFVQYYGGTGLDAALLQMPQVGFLPPSDPRVRGTIEAIERELCSDGFILRYSPETGVDGLPGGEGAFLACSFWLVDAYSLLGRHDDAEQLFEKLLSLRNDLGLLAEEYDPVAKRLVGNFPQAFSHIALVNTANNLVSTRGPARQRSERRAPSEIREASTEPAKV
jgi:GH15 family glucan-1,4-alpha-glucosidase